MERNKLQDEEDAINETREAKHAFAKPDYLKVYFDTAYHGVAHVSESGRFISVNDAFCTILGRSREELLHTDFKKITYNMDLKNDIISADRLIKGNGKAYGMDKRYISSDGEMLIPCHIEVRRIPWDETAKFEHFKVDIYSSGPIENLVKTKSGSFRIKYNIYDFLKDSKWAIAAIFTILMSLAFVAGDGAEVFTTLVDGIIKVIEAVKK